MSNEWKIKLIYLYWLIEDWREDLRLWKWRNSFFLPAGVLTALIISAALSAASFGLQLLLSPKVKTQPKGKLTGDISVSDSIWGAPVYRIYGNRADGEPGGVEVGTNVFFASDIRKTEIQVPGAANNSGGGKGGGSRSNSQKEIHYKVDFAAAIGAGTLRLLRVKLNEDTVYDVSQANWSNEPSGAKTEAESGTRGGTASIVNEGNFSSGQGVQNLNSNGTLTIALAGGSFDVYTLHIGYKSAVETTLDIELNGETISYNFPATGSARGFRTIYKNLPNSSQNLILKNASAATLKIDAVYLEAPFFYEAPIDLPYPPTGVYDGYYNYSGYSRQNLIFEPYTKRNTYALENVNQTNTPVYPDADGLITTTLASGAEMAFYPGTENQPVDSVISAWVASQKGSAAYCPAFRGVAYIRFKDLDFTKWGNFPNVRCLVENIDKGTVEEILLAESALCGLDSADLNFTAGASKQVRGYIVSDAGAPEKVFTDLALLNNLSYAEKSDGKLTVIDKNVRLAQATITRADLAAYSAESDNEPPADDIKSTVPDESEMPHTLEIQFFNPLSPSNFATDRREHIFPFTDSVKKETINLNATLLPTEANSVIKRINQEKWLKNAPVHFAVSHKYAWLDAGDCVDLEIDGETKLFRIESKQGSAPGIFEMTASADELYVSADGGAIVIDLPKERINVPASTLGTILELPLLFNEDQEGIYVAACKYGGGNWNGAALYRSKGGDWQQLLSFNKSCILGRANNAFPNPPNGYVAGTTDTVNSISVDFYNDFAPETVTAPAAADGANMFVVGNEICYVRTWTRDNSQPNRWIGTNIIRRVKNSDGNGHNIGERVVMMTDAVKFLPLEPGEVGALRSFKFVTGGEVLDRVPAQDFTANGFTPPGATLSLSAETIVNNSGVPDIKVVGTIGFGKFNFVQKGKIYQQLPGSMLWNLLGEVTPDGNDSAQFEVFNLAAGLHKFKVVTSSSLGIEQTGPSEEDSITISATNFVINDTVVLGGVIRAYTGFDAQGVYTGRDTNIVPTAVINAFVAISTIKDNGLNCDFEIQGTISNRHLQTSNSDSIVESEVAVFDKFGRLHKKMDGSDAVFYADYKGAGTLASGDFSRKYADPREEAYYRIRVKNSKGWSGYRYLHQNGTMSDLPPTASDINLAPRDLSATSLSSSSIRFSANFTFASNTLILQKREVGQVFADWTDHATGITALPYTATGLPADKELEFRFLSSTGTNNASNIEREKTFQTGQTVPNRTAPSGLTVVPDSNDPDDDLNVDWVRNATDNDAVEIEINGTVSPLGATATHHDIDGIGQLASRSVRVRNKWNSGATYSDWTAIVTGQTEATPAQNPPQNFAGTYDNPNNEVDFSWQAGDGSGQYTLEISDTGANLQDASGTGGWTNITSVIGAGALDYSYQLAQQTTQFSKYFRLKRNDVSGWVGSGEVIIPAQEGGGATPPTWVSIFYNDVKQRFQLTWTPHGGAGAYTINYREQGTGTWQVATAGSSFLSRNISETQTVNDSYWEFRIKRDDVLTEPAAWSDIKTVLMLGSGS